jgi:GTP-binding protein Era
MNYSKFRSGYVAIIGKPNAGKSTLLNSILGVKLSIATHKAQTTRHRVVGIHSDQNHQLVFLDTPGIINPSYALQKSMMNVVQKAVKDADFVLFIHDARDEIIPDDVVEYLQSINKPIALILNKIDLISQEKASKFVETYEEMCPIYPISALQNIGIEGVLDSVKEKIPLGPPFYPPEQLSEHPERFFVSELIREQIFLQFQQEIPYSCTVDIILYEESEKGDHIEAEIIVNRDSQKGMLIGKKGSAIKKLDIASRNDIEHFLGRPCVLKLYVKSREGWRDKDQFLKNFGYD